jgi:ribosomal protein L11 methyltransferase
LPYRIDIPRPLAGAFDQLIELGALDIDSFDSGLAAILPDTVTPDRVSTALSGTSIVASPATGRDNGSVWILRPRSVRVGSIVIAPPGATAPPNAIRLNDMSAFGTGYHPTTARCIEALEDTVNIRNPESILDVGTGSGILALAALRLGVPRAVGIDIDADALAIAASHAELNHMETRFELLHGGPDVVRGSWPLVVANVLAAPLIEMASILVRRVTSGGRLILSGIAESLESDVRRTYQQLGMRHVRSEERTGWVVVVLEASW